VGKMKKLRRVAIEFLNKYGMGFENLDIHKECAKFIREMERGLEGTTSSLDMINTYIGLEEGIPISQSVIAIDAGGTNFRVALVSFNEKGTFKIEHFDSYPMPGSKVETSKSEFYKTVADYLLPIINRSDRIGFSFSYPTDILPNKDGRLRAFNKEVKVRDMQGELIGEGILKALREKGVQGDKKIVMLNDTVATLLGGKAASGGRKFDDYIGFILGTGTNTCYAENNANIKKFPDISGTRGSTIINIESGGFSGIQRGRMDIEFDNSTVDPGKHVFEKMMSGAYQGGLMLEILRRAAVDGLFSAYTTQAISSLGNLETKDLTDFCENPFDRQYKLQSCVEKEREYDNKNDTMLIYYLLDAFYERVARLVTINLAAVILKTGKGKNSSLPVCITVEGTTFNKATLFRKKLGSLC
jgi:hexokinase